MALSDLSDPLNGKLKILTFGAGAIGTYHWWQPGPRRTSACFYGTTQSGG